MIPFETVRASDVWCLNVGRVHFLATEAKKDDREFSAWTGALNPSYVPGDGSFGKITFK